MSLFSDLVWLIPIVYIFIFIIGLSIGKSKPIVMMSISIAMSFVALLISSGVIWERTMEEAVDYSFYFDWFMIGSTVYRVGYELNNSSAFLLLLTSIMHLLIMWLLFYKKEKTIISSVYGYLGLMAFAVSGIILVDSIMLFLICAQLLSYSVYLILSHPLIGFPAKAVFRFITSQLIGYACLYIVVTGLYWYMPSHSLQFTMLETMFSGPALAFTERMKYIISGTLIVSAMIFSGLFPYGNYMKHVSIDRPILRVAIYCFGNALLPVILLLKFYPMISQTAGMMTLSRWIGTIIIIAITIRVLINSKQTTFYIGNMMVGMLLFAYGFHAITFIHVQFAIIMLALIIIYGSALQTKSIIVYGSFLIAMLTLIGVPPLSGYWIQQSLISTIDEQYSTFWYIVALLLTMCYSLSMTINFITYMKKEQEQLRRKGVWVAIIIPALMLIILGLFWLVNSKAVDIWLYNSNWMQSMNIMSMMLTMVSVALGVASAWLFSERITDALSTSLDEIDRNLRKKTENIADVFSRVGHYIILGIQWLERVLVLILTVWIPYPIRKISNIGSEVSMLKNVGLVLLITCIFTVIWIGVKGG